MTPWVSCTWCHITPYGYNDYGQLVWHKDIEPCDYIICIIKSSVWNWYQYCIWKIIYLYMCKLIVTKWMTIVINIMYSYTLRHNSKRRLARCTVLHNISPLSGALVTLYVHQTSLEFTTTYNPDLSAIVWTSATSMWHFSVKYVTFSVRLLITTLANIVSHFAIKNHNWSVMIVDLDLFADVPASCLSGIRRCLCHIWTTGHPQADECLTITVRRF